MRRLLALAAFGFGFYLLWTTTERFDNVAGLGVMGVGLLLEFMGS